MSDTVAANGVESGGTSQRRRSLLIATFVFVVIGTAWLLHWFFVARIQVSTDDAYVAGNIIQVTAQTSGTVVAIRADDTNFVKAGQPLVQLDDTNANVALAQAEAELAQAVRQVRSLFTGNDALRAKIAVQESALAKAESDLQRRQGLTTSGAVSFEELHHSETAVKAARADLLTAKEQLAGNLALTDNTAIANHPNVLIAAARVRSAFLERQRTSVPAAVDGYIAKRNVQLGQHIVPGAPLMAIVPLKNVWVDANFKESQLAAMRIGQPVVLTADIYGSHVDYHGRIVGLAAGTGSAFSLLPAQNATGNWIKVVQRLPARIELDPKELQEHPLRIGLSVIATVDISNQQGAQLATANSAPATYSTDVYSGAARDADALVQRIIDSNSGVSSHVKASAHFNSNVSTNFSSNVSRKANTKTSARAHKHAPKALQDALAVTAH